MENRTFLSDYLRHEIIYAANPLASGWNSLDVDQEILSYVYELLDQAQVVPPASILELGCGMGNLVIPLAKKGFHVMGIDISPTAIDRARRRAYESEGRAHFQVGNVISVETYQDLEAVDCVLDGLCWHCIIGPDRKSFLDFVRKALKPRGYFLVITMCGNPRSERLQAQFDLLSRCINDGSVAERYLGNAQDLEEELVRAGFDLIYCRLVEGNCISGDQDMFLAVAQVP